MFMSRVKALGRTTTRSSSSAPTSRAAKRWHGPCASIPAPSAKSNDPRLRALPPPPVVRGRASEERSRVHRVRRALAGGVLAAGRPMQSRQVETSRRRRWPARARSSLGVRRCVRSSRARRSAAGSRCSCISEIPDAGTCLALIRDGAHLVPASPSGTESRAARALASGRGRRSFRVRPRTERTRGSTRAPAAESPLFAAALACAAAP